MGWFGNNEGRIYSKGTVVTWEVANTPQGVFTENRTDYWGKQQFLLCKGQSRKHPSCNAQVHHVLIH